MSVSQERIVIKMQIVLILLVHTDVNVDMAMKEMGCFVKNCKFYMTYHIFVCLHFTFRGVGQFSPYYTSCKVVYQSILFFFKWTKFTNKSSTIL